MYLLLIFNDFSYFEIVIQGNLFLALYCNQKLKLFSSYTSFKFDYVNRFQPKLKLAREAMNNVD